MATIQQRISKKGSISYRIKVSLGYDETGKQVTKSMTFKPDKSLTPKKAYKEAQKQAFIFEEQCKAEREKQKEITFEKLAKEWLELVSKTESQKKSSIARLESCQERTYKAIGKVDIGKVSFQMVQKFILSLSKKGVNKRNGQGLSAKTQKHYLTFISDVINYSIQCGLRTDNPCKSVAVTKTSKKEKDIYSLEEVKEILESLKNNADVMKQTFFTVVAYLGLRRGEILGLEFGDFDFDNQTVTITRTSNYCGKKMVCTQTHRKPTKVVEH